MWPALAAAIDEVISVLKIVVTFNRLGYIIARIQLRAVQCFNQANLIFIDYGGVEKPDIEQPGLGFVATFKRHRLRVNTVIAGRKNIDLRTLLPAGGDVLLSILKVEVAIDGLTQQSARIELSAIGR